MIRIKFPSFGDRLKAIVSIILGLLWVGIVHAQVGIGTNDPKTTLQVDGDPATTTTADGIQGPSLTLAQLDAKIASYGTDQDGAIVYIDDVTVASTVAETANITATGYYYYDAPNDVWKAMGDASSSSNNFYLGQDTLGGIVFYIYLDANGYQRGLIVNKNESTAQWQSNFTTTNATLSWDGVYNTGLMTSSPAANYVNGLTDGGFTDWYLPSIDELIILWHNRFHANNALNAGGFTLLSNTSVYWSSTEDSDDTLAFGFYFLSGYSNFYGKPGTFKVRAVRAF